MSSSSSAKPFNKVLEEFVQFIVWTKFILWTILAKPVKGSQVRKCTTVRHVCIFGQGIIRNTKYMYFSNTPFMPFNFPCVYFIVPRYMHEGHRRIWFSYLRYQHLLYTYLVYMYTKPVNIHFHVLWLATPVRDIHWISTSLQNTMDLCANNHLSSRVLTR